MFPYLENIFLTFAQIHKQYSNYRSYYMYHMYYMYILYVPQYYSILSLKLSSKYMEPIYIVLC